jgi:hypothetical protein
MIVFGMAVGLAQERQKTQHFALAPEQPVELAAYYVSRPVAQASLV